MTRAVMLAGGLAAAAALAGCGGGGSKAAAPEGAAVAAGCGGAAVRSLPAAFPARLPLPDGYRLGSLTHEHGYAVATGSAAGTLQGVRDFYERALPKQGFALGEGDAEEHEAETDFDGNGVGGHLRLRDGGGGCVNVQLAVKHG